MKLGQAVSYFSTVSIDGYDKAKTRWDSEISHGSYKAFDQFITNRSFGQKKRMIAVPADERIDSKYGIIRVSDGTRYLVAEENSDIRRDELYQYIYLLQIAEYEAIIYERQTTTKVSGMPGDPVIAEVDRTYCDVERHSGTTKAGRDDIKLSLITMSMPLDTNVNTDSLIDVGTERYFVREVNRLLGHLDVLVTKFGEDE